MVNPVPGHSVSTPYGKRGSYWSCDEDSNGNGIHTGVDYAAPAGAKVVAARPGKAVHSNHGSAFGSHQIDILCDDGTRDFYAHMRSRVAHGTKVKAGEKVGEIGSEGNVTGPHLHFERHATHSGGWSCSVVRDPAPSLKWEDEDAPLTEQDLVAVAKRVNAILGDYDAAGAQEPKGDPEHPDRGDERLRQIETVTRQVQADVDKILKAVTA